jgi:hypothetical protein
MSAVSVDELEEGQEVWCILKHTEILSRKGFDYQEPVLKRVVRSTSGDLRLAQVDRTDTPGRDGLVTKAGHANELWQCKQFGPALFEERKEAQEAYERIARERAQELREKAAEIDPDT